MAAVLLHILGHGLAKAVAFCARRADPAPAAGSAAHRRRPRPRRRAPALGRRLRAGLLALLGLPPFSLFASELGIARAGFAAGHGWAVAIAFALILVAFAASPATPPACSSAPAAAAASTARTAPAPHAAGRRSAPGWPPRPPSASSLGPLHQLLDAAAASSPEATDHASTASPPPSSTSTAPPTSPPTPPACSATATGWPWSPPTTTPPSTAGGEAIRVVYLFTAGPPDRRIELYLRTDPADPHIPSLAALSFPASRFEREMRDLFGIEPDNHPHAAAAGAPPALAGRLAPDAPRRRPAPAARPPPSPSRS